MVNRWINRNDGVAHVRRTEDGTCKRKGGSGRRPIGESELAAFCLGCKRKTCNGGCRAFYAFQREVFSSARRMESGAAGNDR